MVTEIREAKEGEDGSYPIEHAENFEFTFFSDIDQDAEQEKVRYYIQGTDLVKEVIDPEGFPPVYSSSPKKTFITHYIRKEPPIFTYLDAEGEELAYPAPIKKIKAIKVYLVVDVDNLQPPPRFVLESAIRFRNL